MPQDNQTWCPFRPTANNLDSIAQDVAEIGAIQQKAMEKNKHVNLPDRVAHQYQIAGGKVRATVSAPYSLSLFGVAVTWIALFEGYDAPPTAEGVSGATTRTVVTSSLAILGLDFILTAFMFRGA